VKVEHQRPARLLQPLKIPQWNWEEIRMDFIVGLPRTQARYDSIWVIVDHLTEVAHFSLVKTTYSSAKLAELYMSRIMCQGKLCQTEVPNSHLSFGRNFMSQ
jgi:hypothetical protein